MRNTIIASVAAFLATTTLAMAQAQAPLAAKQAPPAAQQPSTPIQPTVVPQSGGATGNRAMTAADARVAFASRVKSKEEACKAKGALYTFKAPHGVGDPDGKGGFYVTSSNGSCRLMSMKSAMEAGLVTVNKR